MNSQKVDNFSISPRFCSQKSSVPCFSSRVRIGTVEKEPPDLIEVTSNGSDMERGVWLPIQLRRIHLGPLIWLTRGRFRVLHDGLVRIKLVVTILGDSWDGKQSELLHM